MPLLISILGLALVIIYLIIVSLSRLTAGTVLNQLIVANQLVADGVMVGLAVVVLMIAWSTIFFSRAKDFAIGNKRSVLLVLFVTAICFVLLVLRVLHDAKVW